MATYNVFRVENRSNGHEEHIGTVDADSAGNAFSLAEAKYECSGLHHLVVWTNDADDDATGYCLHDYKTNEKIGTAKLTDEQFAHYQSMAQQPGGLIRLGALPHDWYDLDSEFQDTHEDTTVYLD